MGIKKKGLALAVILCCLFIAVKPCAVMAEETDDSTLIQTFYETLNSKDYEKRATMAAGAYREDLLWMLSDEEKRLNHIGMYNVSRVTEVAVLGEISAYEYPDLMANAEETADDYKAYLVRSYITAYEESEFYSTGERYDIIFVGTVDGERKILSMNRALAGTVNCFLEESCGESGISPNSLIVSNAVCKPDEIKVKMSDTEVITVDFKIYCKKVAAQEVGYDSYSMERHKACCIAVKNYALYKVFEASPDMGFHIWANQSDGQEYFPDIQYTNWPNVMAAMEATWDICLTDSSGKCVYTEYRSGTKAEHTEYDHQGSGTLLQNRAKEMADAGKSYKDILDYFYSNSPVTNYTTLLYPMLTDHSYSYLNEKGYYQCSKCGQIKYGLAAADGGVEE